MRTPSPPSIEDGATNLNASLSEYLEGHSIRADFEVNLDVFLPESEAPEAIGQQHRPEDDLLSGQAEESDAQIDSAIHQRPYTLAGPSGRAHRASITDQNGGPPASTPPKAAAVGWRDLPNKRQLAILTLARLSEPLTQSSLQAYMFYQLKSFDPNLPDSTIASQAGLLQGCFTAAQFVTAVIWGSIADADWAGRKRVLLVGLFGTCVSCVGFGFSRTFAQAAIFRTLGGTLNGNVGVMRTMISEIIREKKFQSRAFLLLPMCFNIGVIIGPILGGLLANPIGSYPQLFGDGSLIGGKHGVWWLKHWPYALPNLTSAVFLFMSAVAVLFGLEETLESKRGRPDFGLRLGQYIADISSRIFSRRHHHYTAVNTDDEDISVSPNGSHPNIYELEARLPTAAPPAPTHPHKPKRKLPFRRIWTRNVLSTFLSHAILALHVSTFNSLWFIFLSTPRPPCNQAQAHPAPPNHHHLPTTGGLGFPLRTIGLTLAAIGLIGLPLQLLLYPPLTTRLGTLRSYRWSLALFPLTYTLAPFLALVPAPLLWPALLPVLAIQVLARTFALPAAAILVNNCCPHPSVLGAVHGVAQSVSSASRTLGPVLGGWGFGRGLQAGVAGAVWWALGLVAVAGWAVGWLVWEGDGHEIWLEGEAEGEARSGMAGRKERAGE